MTTHVTDERLCSVKSKLNAFYEQGKILHLLFHGAPGTGKKTIVMDFIDRIYMYNKDKIKNHVMFVNCAHRKGIKFIREELKFFAKTNIRQTKKIGEQHPVTDSGTVPFKTIVLFNAEYLTIDAQSALRRCIEQFSHTTRFFLVVVNKHRLLAPIMSRFCEIYILQALDTITGKIINLHRPQDALLVSPHQAYLDRVLIGLQGKTPCELIRLVNEMYQEGVSGKDLVMWIGKVGDDCRDRYNSIHLEYRCEPLLRCCREPVSSIHGYRNNSKL